MFTSPESIAFSFLNFDVHWYGLIMSISMLIGLFTVLRIRKKFYNDISTDAIFDITFILIILGIISARLYYVIVDWQYFSKHLIEIPAIWNGGISIQGAIIGCIVALIIYSRQNKINFFRYADLFCYGLVIGQVFGRWGNFFNSEAFGTPTELAWKLYIPLASRPLEYKGYEFFHPTFLYESIGNLCIFAILLLMLYKIKEMKNGTIFYTYLILYSILRIFVEEIRVDSVLNVLGIPIAQLTSIFIIIVSIICMYIQHSKDKSKIL